MSPPPPPPPSWPPGSAEETARRRLQAGCTNTCSYVADGICDDGGPGSQYSACVLETDCDDCGVRIAPPPPPAAQGHASCTEACQYAMDGFCDDGGGGSQYSDCYLGSDCTDCGARVMPPSVPPLPPRPPAPVGFASVAMPSSLHGLWKFWGATAVGNVVVFAPTNADVVGIFDVMARTFDDSVSTQTTDDWKFYGAAA
eukprot:5032093-Prymnesium_polylepis.1